MSIWIGGRAQSSALRPASDHHLNGSVPRRADGNTQTVELLRNGEFHDRAIADHSGQFVMVPPRLPPGEYELTLRSRQPDGNQATSKQSAVVALQPPLKDQTVVAPMTLDVVLSKTVAHKGGPIGAVSR
jgi:hypothetical protein